MTAFDKLKASAMWNEKYELPLGPGNNPHLYCAYANLVLKLNQEKLPNGSVFRFEAACDVEYENSWGRWGLFYRFPDGSGGDTSHDEVMGRCALQKTFAFDTLSYLRRHLGNFNSQKRWSWNPLRFNLFRIYWLYPYLKACAGERVGFIGQQVICFRLWEAVRFGKHHDTSKCGPGPRLRMWLMASAFRKYPRISNAWYSYAFELSYSGVKLNEDLGQEPGVQELADLAPPRWLHPEDL